MPGQIIFFEKNKADFENGNVVVTASEGNLTSDRVIDRDNLTAWVTEGSLDANNTTLEIDMVDTRELDSVVLIGHNFKSFKVEYWNGSAWSDFSPAADVTNGTETGSYFSVNTVFTSKVKLTVRGTHTPDDDKILKQFIVTRMIGQLQGWPIIKNPKMDRNLKVSKMLSGRKHVVENAPAYSARLDVKNWNNDADLTVVETLHEMNEGFLFWPCGGDESQFATLRKGYRFEDIFLVRVVSAHIPEFYKGLYSTGLDISFDLAEVNT